MIKSQRLIFLSLLLISIWSACTEHKTLSPEESVRQYAQYLNQGRLAEAKKMSTPSGQAYLEALSEIIMASSSSLDTSEIKIKSVECLQQSGDTLHCTSIEFDGFEEYKKEYWLVPGTEGWLIDHPTNQGTVRNSEEILEKEE